MEISQKYIISLLVGSSIYIMARFGISRSEKAEKTALYCSIIALLWAAQTIIFNSVNPEMMSTLLPTEIANSGSYSEEIWSFIKNKSGKIGEIESISVYHNYSKIFLLLTVIIMPITILASEKKTEMVSALLITEALLIGAFTTSNFIFFYIAFEAVLIPMFILIGASGSERSLFRNGAAYRIFLYTFAGSLLMLVAIICLTLTKISTDINILMFSVLTETDNSNYILFPLIAIAFATKIPMVPVHLWLPEAHTIAPTPISMILAALLLKLGGYGILKWLIPIFPEESVFYAPYILVIAVISTIYACLTCLRQIDIKRIIAYSSIVHMNICIFSIFTLSELAQKGAIFEMFSHGIISAAMFFLIGVVYNRYDTRTLKYLRGTAGYMPIFATFFFIFILANSAVPITCGFVGEFLMACGSMQKSPVLTVILTLAFIVNAGNNIWLFNRLCFGPPSKFINKVADLTRKESYLLFPLLFLVFLLGLFPNYINYLFF